jgi:hypothetical protein
MILIILIAALGLTGVIPTGEEQDQTSGAGVRFFVEGDDLVIDCEVADSEFERTKGLMGRTSLGDREGMLFVYDSPKVATFWMKDTYLDLDIIFISGDLRVMKISEADSGEGKSDSELEIYSSEDPCLYVVEVNQGLSNGFGIVPGIVVEIDL